MSWNGMFLTVVKKLRYRDGHTYSVDTEKSRIFPGYQDETDLILRNLPGSEIFGRQRKS